MDAKGLKAKAQRKKQAEAKRRKAKANAAQPKQAVYIYKCEVGHGRTEAVKISDPPICTTCHMTTGNVNRMNLVRRTSRLAK